MTGTSEASRTFTPRPRPVLWVSGGVVVAGFAATALFFDLPQGRRGFALDLYAIVLLVFFAVAAIAVARARIEVRADAFVVRELLRTRVVPFDRIARVIHVDQLGEKNKDYLFVLDAEGRSLLQLAGFRWRDAGIREVLDALPGEHEVMRGGYGPTDLKERLPKAISSWQDPFSWQFGLLVLTVPIVNFAVGIIGRLFGS